MNFGGAGRTSKKCKTYDKGIISYTTHNEQLFHYINFLILILFLSHCGLMPGLHVSFIRPFLTFIVVATE